MTSLREEIWNELDRYTTSNSNTRSLTNDIIKLIEKRIDERIKHIGKKKEHAEIFLDGLAIDSVLQELENLKEELSK